MRNINSPLGIPSAGPKQNQITMRITHLLRTTLPIFLLLLAFTACDEDSTDDILSSETLQQQEELAFELEATLPPTTSDPSDPAAPQRCLTLVYPVSFTTPDGSTLTANDQEDIRNYLKEADRKRRALNFIYPLEVTTIDGQVVELEDFSDFRRARRTCAIEHGRWVAGARRKAFRECYDINYPIEVTVNDETLSIENGRQLLRAFTSRGDSTRARIVYPINVTLKADSSTLKIDDRAAFVRLRRACLN
jgi:hypothetical protein